MKIRFDFVTNSSSSSFVAVSIEDAELARICDEYGINMSVYGDTVSCNYDLGESELPIAPKGADFIQWFLNFVSEVGLADESAKAEILAHKKEIEDSFVESNIVYEHYCTEDYYYNSHWEETRDKEKIVVKGFDASKWDEIWDKQDWDEIAKLDDSGLDISRLSPSQYPFWLFLSEGWAYPNSRDMFVRNMMDKYATKVIPLTSSYSKSESVQGKKDELQKMISIIDKMAADPETIDFSMKTIAASFLHITNEGIYSYASGRYKQHLYDAFQKDASDMYANDDRYDPEQKRMLIANHITWKWGNYLRDVYKNAISETGAFHANSISGNCDYVMVSNPIKGACSKSTLEEFIGRKYNLWDGSKYNFTLISEEEYELSMYECFIDRLGRDLSEIENANRIRQGKNKPPIEVIWEDQLHDYLTNHTSMGGTQAKQIIGPNGTVRLPVPEQYKKMADEVFQLLRTLWPNRSVNRRSKAYENYKDAIFKCYTKLGYPSEEAFFDAYGYSVKESKKLSKDTNTEGDYQYEINKKKEVTITGYVGTNAHVIIPDTIEGGKVKVIGKEAFSENNYVEEVEMPDCIDTLRGKAFSYCKNLKAVKLSNNISKIVKDTFEGCSNLSKINISDNVTTLDYGTFRDCPLESIHIGKSLTAFDRAAFYQSQHEYEGTSVISTKASDVKEITIDSNNKNYIAIESMVLTADGKVLVAALGGQDSCEIPSGVEIIGDNAFIWQSYLKWISLPASLRIIGNSAFERTDLRTISFPKNLKLIGACAFRNCRNLHSATFKEGLEKIYDGAFKETDIEHVILPDSVKELGFECFSIFGFSLKYNMSSIEPAKWIKAVNKWDRIRDGKERYPDPEYLNTKSYIEELQLAGLKTKSDEQLSGNIMGFGLLIAMMKYLYTKAEGEFSIKDRLLLEKIVISKEMESILGTDLTSVLAFYKEKSAKQMGECLKHFKTIATQDQIYEMFNNIREAFPDNSDEVDKLLKSVAESIGREA